MSDVVLVEMPLDPKTVIDVSALLTEVSGRSLLMLAVRAPLGRSRGLRLRVKLGNQPAKVRVALVVSGQLALRPTATDALLRSRIPVQISLVPTLRGRGLPADLADALATAEADLNALPAHEATQLLLMIGESSNAEIRRMRVEAAVRAVMARNSRVER